MREKSITVGALLGLALFFGVVFAVRFFGHGNVGPGVLSSLVAAVPVAALVHEAVRNRRRALSLSGREAPPAVPSRRRRVVVLVLVTGVLTLAVVLVFLAP